MAQDYKKFVALGDLHYGYERKSGHKTPLHDEKAMEVALAFTKDFKPDVLILAGDILDAGCLSHHNEGKPGRTEGMRIQADADGCRKEFIDQLPNAAEKVYILGNHDGDWLTDFEESNPAVEGMFNVKSLLKLDDSWKMIESGGHYNLGRLVFLHGNQLSGGEQVAKNAVIAYEKNCRFWHFHTAQLYSKNTPFDTQYPKTGMGVGCLCKKAPHYGKGKPNRWSQGFLYGYVMPDGSFNDYPVTIVKGQAVVNGKLYKA